MSTIKVNKIENTSTTDGGIEVDTSGHVKIDGQQMPTAGALSNRNLIINGAMQVAQRSTSAVTVSNNSNEGYSTLDRWHLNFNDSLAGAVSFEQSSDSPAGFANSIKIQCSTTNSSLTGNQSLSLSQRIEAQNVQLLNYGSSDAVKITLSWYMKVETYAGPISVNLRLRDGTNEYYTISVTPTTSWARYSLDIPESTSGTVDDDNGEGLRVSFFLAANTSGVNSASSDSTAWSTTRSDYRDNIGNLLSNTSNAFYITGVQLEVGEKATPFEHRSYGDELARCRRYCQLVRHTRYSPYVIRGSNGNVGSTQPWMLPVAMRSSVGSEEITISSLRIFNGLNSTSSSTEAGGVSVSSDGTDFRFYFHDISTLSNNELQIVSNYSSSQNFVLDAEL